MTKREIAIQLYEQGFEVKDIAEKLGLGVSTVHKYSTNTKRRAALRTRNETALQMYEQGVAEEDIAKELGVSKYTIHKWLLQQGAIVQGEQNETCPYSDDCFRCPKSDCVVDQNKAMRYNKLDSDRRSWGYVKAKHA